MKIKIIKCEGDKWYSNKIGKIYNVVKVREGKCFILRNYRTILRTVKFDDAEIVE